MAQADAASDAAEPQHRWRPAAAFGERLARALRPSDVSAGPLRWFGLAMLVLAALFPLLGGPFYTRLAIETLLLGALALSVDILLGYAGLLSLGQAAYFGLAAYVSALMYLHVTQSFWLVALAALAVAGLFALVLGAVAIRAKGVYFALITFGAAEILSKIAHNTRAIGGSDGLLGIPVPTIPLAPGLALDLRSNLVFYYAVLAALVLIYVGTRRVLATPFGSVLRAIRHNADRVPYLGYNPVLVQAPGLRDGGRDRRLRRARLSAVARVRRAAPVRFRNVDQGGGDVAGRRRRHPAGAARRQRRRSPSSSRSSAATRSAT